MWNFFLKNNKFTHILIVLILAIGIVSIARIPKEANPEIDFPIGVVTTVFPGASALEVEEFITKPIEDKLAGLTDVDEITSTSSQGMSSIVVNFNMNANGNEKIVDLKEQVDLAKSDLPEDATDPTVTKIRFSDIPIISISLSGPYSLGELKETADTLKDEIERVSGVSRVNVIGGLEREYQVIIDRAQLNRYKLTIGQVTQAIKLANSDIPVGSIETGSEVFTIRFAGKLTSAEDVKNVPISATGNTPILVRDVADVRDDFAEARSISRLSIGGERSLPSVSLKVFKVSGGNILSIIDNIDLVVDDARGAILTDDITVKTTEDNAEFIRDDLTNLTLNGLETIIIVFLLLLFFLGFKEAILAGIAIPMTFLITFSVLNFLGYTLNSLTLFSLILSLGILVDSAIVITEAMNNAIRKGTPVRDAAYNTIAKYKVPLISGTLTTIFAFIPMLLVGGIMGKYIRTIPVSVSIVLFGSLFVALTIIPILGMYILRTKVSGEEVRLSPLQEKLERRKNILKGMQDGYMNILSTLQTNRRKEKMFFGTLILLFFMSLALPISGLLKMNMFPPADQDTVYINLESPIGTPLSATNTTFAPLEELLREDRRVESFVVNVGSAANTGDFSDGFGGGSGNVGHIIVNLDKERSESSTDITADIRGQILSLYAGSVTRISVNQLGNGPGVVAPVEIRIEGDDLEELNRLSRDVEEALESIQGTTDINSSVKESNGEFVMYVDRMKAQLYGLSAAHIAGILRNSVYGSDATTISRNSEDIDVNVRFKLDPYGDDELKTTQADVNAIGSLTVATPRGDVPLSTFLTTKLEYGRASIAHKDSTRIIRITSDVLEGVQAQQVFTEFEVKLEEEIDVPQGYSVTFGGEREDIQESFGQLLRAMILGIFMIAALLVWQFRSYRQPLFILVTIPLAIIGIFPGLTLVDQPLSFPGFIGIVALAGIVVNNAIILIDEINTNRKGGMQKHDAVREAAKSRLQPILLTTITTVAGILPLAITNETWGPLGYSIVFGLVFSALLTLVVVPLLYTRYGEEELD